MKSLNFSKGLVKSGTKNVSEASPKLTATSTYSNFKLNNKAMVALDIEPDDRVVMFDMKDNGATGQDDRYYICKAGFEIDGEEQGALVSKQRNFRYSGIYNTILNNDFEVSSISADDLVEKGLMVKRKSSTGKGNNYIATKIVSFDVVPVNDGEPIEIPGGVERPVFMLTNAKFADHTPKSVGGEEEEIAEVAE